MCMARGAGGVRTASGQYIRMAFHHSTVQYDFRLFHPAIPRRPGERVRRRSLANDANPRAITLTRTTSIFCNLKIVDCMTFT